MRRSARVSVPILLARLPGADHLHIAAWLKQNEEGLQFVVQTTKRRHYYSRDSVIIRRCGCGHQFLEVGARGQRPEFWLPTANASFQFKGTPPLTNVLFRRMRQSVYR